MSIQATYLDGIAPGFAGGLVNMEIKNLISRTVEDSGGIDFGLAVAQGVNDKGCTVSDGTAATFIGVTVREQSVSPTAPNGFEYQEEARIMTKGVIWVANSGGVAAGDGVAVGAAGILTTGSEIAGARWDTTAADGELAQLRLA